MQLLFFALYWMSTAVTIGKTLFLSCLPTQRQMEESFSVVGFCDKENCQNSKLREEFGKCLDFMNRS